MSAELSPPVVSALLAALGLLIAASIVWLTLTLRRWWKARVLGARMTIASAGERRAEEWLAARGYRVLERQVTRRCVMHINQRVAEYDVRADLLVRMGDEDVVVEVKTGEAADPRLPTTRRQLREYCDVFGVECIYVFDASNERLHEVRFLE